MLRLSSAGDLAHGIVKAQAQDLDEELDGVAGQFALGPAPVAVFEEQAREGRSEEHTSELQSQSNLVCRLLLEKKKKRTHLPQYLGGPQAARVTQGQWLVVHAEQSLVDELGFEQVTHELWPLCQSVRVIPYAAA